MDDRSNNALLAFRFGARSFGLMVIRSPDDEDPLPEGGSRARAAEVKEELVVERLEGLEGLEGLEWCRIGLEAREAVLEMKALVGLVRGTNPAG